MRETIADVRAAVELEMSQRYRAFVRNPSDANRAKLDVALYVHKAIAGNLTNTHSAQLVASWNKSQNVHTFATLLW